MRVADADYMRTDVLGEKQHARAACTQCSNTKRADNPRAAAIRCVERACEIAGVGTHNREVAGEVAVVRAFGNRCGKMRVEKQERGVFRVVPAHPEDGVVDERSCREIVCVIAQDDRVELAEVAAQVWAVSSEHTLRGLDVCACGAATCGGAQRVVDAEIAQDLCPRAVEEPELAQYQAHFRRHYRTPTILLVRT